MRLEDRIRRLDLFRASPLLSEDVRAILVAREERAISKIIQKDPRKNRVQCLLVVRDIEPAKGVLDGD